MTHCSTTLGRQFIGAPGCGFGFNFSGSSVRLCS